MGSQPAPGIPPLSGQCHSVSWEAASSNDSWWRDPSVLLVLHPTSPCSLSFATASDRAAATSLNTLCHSGCQSYFMSTIFTKIFGVEKLDALPLNKAGCCCGIGWEKKKSVLKQKLMQLPLLFQGFNKTKKRWLICMAMLELVHQPAMHFLTTW